MKRVTGLSAILVFFFAVPASFAQQAPGTDVQRQVDDAFRQVLSQPRDLAIGYNYARALIDSGNYEGGIAALERLLLDPAASPTIRLELAYLYYRLGSYEAAESYARAAEADPRLSDELRADARRLAADTVRRTAPSQLTGNITLGLRAQSNPTAAPSSDLIRSLGIDVRRPDGVKAKSDLDPQLSGRVEHVWDFQQQNGLALVSTLTGFANHYLDGSDYGTRPGKTDGQDLALVEGTTGLRFMPIASLKGLTLRPYVVVADVLLDGRQFFASWGGGLDVAYRFADGAWLVEATAEVRRNEYDERADVSDADGQSGPDSILRLRATHEFAPGRVVVGEVTLRDHSTDRSYFDYQGVDTRLSVLFNYLDPFGFDKRTWTTTPYVGFTYRDYGGPDPAVSSTISREDTEWRLGVWNLVPISDAWSMLVQAEYAHVESNLANYEYDNATALVGVSWRF